MIPGLRFIALGKKKKRDFKNKKLSNYAWYFPSVFPGDHRFDERNMHLGHPTFVQSDNNGTLLQVQNFLSNKTRTYIIINFATSFDFFFSLKDSKMKFFLF